MLNKIKSLYLHLYSSKVPDSEKVIGANSQEIKDRNWSLYDKDAIDYTLIESEKYLSETLIVFRKTNDVSFVTLSLYLAIIGYGLSKVIENKGIFNLFISDLIIIIGTAIALYKLWHNLWEGEMYEIGVLPEIFINDHTESITLKEQIQKLKVKKISSNQGAILHNMNEINRRNRNIRVSINVLITALVLAGIFVMISIVHPCSVS